MSMGADEARRKAFPATVLGGYPGTWHHSPEFFRLRYGDPALAKPTKVTKRKLRYTTVLGQKVCLG